MYHFTVENMEASAASCNKCCCERLSLKPGTKTKISVGYAPWAVPIGRLHCGPSFDLVQMETCPVTTGAPQKIGGTTVAFDTAMNTMLEGDLATKVEDPDGGSLTFKALGLYGPQNGVLIVEPNGMFDYTPTPGYEGPDRFFFTATDESAKTTTFEALIGVGSTTGLTMKETPHVAVDMRTVSVDQRYYHASFAIAVAPTAALCEVWRLTVMQAALDCDCNCYNRTDCYDIEIAKC